MSLSTIEEAHSLTQRQEDGETEAQAPERLRSVLEKRNPAFLSELVQQRDKVN